MTLRRGSLWNKSHMIIAQMTYADIPKDSTDFPRVSKECELHLAPMGAGQFC